MTSAQPVHARLGPRGDQVVEVVVDHGYRPHSIVARAGLPLRLVFRRRDDDTCTDRIVFSSPHLDRRLARGVETTIVLPPQPPGEIRFTCGMGRYHGEIELQPEPSHPLEVVRAVLNDRLRRGWRFIRGPVEPTVEQEGGSIVPTGLALGEFGHGELDPRAHARSQTAKERPS